MSPAVPLPMLSDRRSFVVIIGVEPRKRTHTASALEPDTHRVLATLQMTPPSRLWVPAAMDHHRSPR